MYAATNITHYSTHSIHELWTHSWVNSSPCVQYDCSILLTKCWVCWNTRHGTGKIWCSSRINILVFNFLFHSVSLTSWLGRGCCLSRVSHCWSYCWLAPCSRRRGRRVMEALSWSSLYVSFFSSYTTLAHTVYTGLADCKLNSINSRLVQLLDWWSCSSLYVSFFSSYTTLWSC